MLIISPQLSYDIYKFERFLGYVPCACWLYNVVCLYDWVALMSDCLVFGVVIRSFFLVDQTHGYWLWYILCVSNHCFFSSLRDWHITRSWLKLISISLNGVGDRIMLQSMCSMLNFNGSSTKFSPQSISHGTTCSLAPGINFL